MAVEPIVITLDRDLEDLVPVFLAQRKTDLATLNAALAAGDFAAMRRAGHGMAGAGASYGFDYLSVLGERIVEAARAGNATAVEGVNREFDDYMARLVVKYM
ncbi:MAG TPA: Hpt domain-containing protein [Burkholderiales bacterium]|nr:Hpt domain-containing protein [Burkholderiales bacterium]